MLNENELDSNSIQNKQHYFAYMKTYMNNISTFMEFLKDFDDWLYEHRLRLQALYDADTTYKSDFITWARNRFAVWSFHRYEDDLQSEINDIIEGK